MKVITWALLICMAIVGCSTPDSSEPTIIFATDETWPESFRFCRPKDDDSGLSDCWHIQSVDEWLALKPKAGEKIPTWPETGPLPPLPEGLTWEYRMYTEGVAGQYIWTIVEIK